MQLFLTLHADHEGGNVSAFSAQVVGSALSDVYYALAGGLSGLAGPLHGLANQMSLKWLLSLLEACGGQTPTKEKLTELVWKQLKSGQVVPGFGHPVLRVTDPRYVAFVNFGEKHCADDPVFKLVVLAGKIVPQILNEQGKAKNPWPNIDAGSGALLYHFGLKEWDYYTVLFSVARALGITAQTVISRGLQFPLIRPKSITTEALKAAVSS